MHHLMFSKPLPFIKFAAGGALGGATFGKTMGKTKYLGMSSKTLKKGAIAVGATYVGYKLAKGAGKALGKAYFYGMYRPSIYHGRSWYFDNDDYYYRGELNDRCDIWYSVEMRQEIMRCDQGYYYNYDMENPNSSNYWSGGGSTSDKIQHRSVSDHSNAIFDHHLFL